jgi:hypothetical protein
MMTPSNGGKVEIVVTSFEGDSRDEIYGEEEKLKKSLIDIQEEDIQIESEEQGHQNSKVKFHANSGTKLDPKYPSKSKNTKSKSILKKKLDLKFPKIKGNNPSPRKNGSKTSDRQSDGTFRDINPTPMDLHISTMNAYNKKMENVTIPNIPIPSTIIQATYYMVDLRNYYFSNKKTEEAMLYRNHFEQTYEMIRKISDFKVVAFTEKNPEDGKFYDVLSRFGTEHDKPSTSRKGANSDQKLKPKPKKTILFRQKLKSSNRMKIDISNRKRVQYPKLNYNGMQQLKRDKQLEDEYNGGGFVQNPVSRVRDDENVIKEFESVGEIDRYLVIDLDETMIFTEFLTRESNDEACLYLDLNKGSKYKVSILKISEKLTQALDQDTHQTILVRIFREHFQLLHLDFVDLQ